MGSKRLAALGVVALAWLILSPTNTWAQTGTIAGVVKDTTGAVMPGVTVEASSPALIEKVRTAVTDGEGQYKVVNLVPGKYAVTFTLTGFSTVKRDGIDLSAGFTATVNADLRVGALEETITVSGQAPMVDVQNTRQQTVMTRDTIDAIPAAKSPQSFAVLVPGVIAAGAVGPSAQDTGGTVSDRVPSLIVHGSRPQEMPHFYDGMRYNNMNATPGGGHLIWAENAGAVQEYTVEVGALSAEADVSGVRQNAVPKTGGNTHRGNFFGNYTQDSLVANNVADPATAYSFSAIWDFNPTAGGPLKLDKLWYFGSYRYWGIHEHPPGSYYDTNNNDYVYTPDLSRPGINRVSDHSESLRLTWQATPRNKFGIWADNHQRTWDAWGLSATATPEATYPMETFPNLVAQVTWSVPVTNRLLIDAGYTFHPESWSGFPRPEVKWETYPYTELSTGVNFGAAANGYRQHRTRQENMKFYVSYVTGSHAFKVGFQDMWGYRTIDNWILAYSASLNLLNGVPASLTQFTYPYSTKADVPWYLGAFAQDQWTIKRMTLNLGIRFDALNSSVPAQTYPAQVLVDARSFPAISDAPDWKDINPRLGVAYDLFGTGKTAVKVNVGRYVQGVTTGYSDNVNPIVAAVNQANRTWTDTNGNYTPDCNLKSIVANGECGALSNVNFGKGIVTSAYDPDLLNGWRKRPYDWEIQTALQHELLQGLSGSVTYIRHWFGNNLVTDNLAVSPSDYSPFYITVPTDSRLSNSGQQLGPFYDINPNKFGQVNNFVTFAKNFGTETDVYTGVDVSVSARLPRGVVVQGGFNTGHEVWDNCDVVGKVDNAAGTVPTDIQRAGLGTPLITNINGVPSPGNLFCHIAPPLQTQVKLIGSYPLPWGLAASAAFQSIPGPQITASYVVPNARIAPSLGRNLAAGAGGNVIVQLIRPGTVYGDRLNQVDTRFSRTFRFSGNRRAQAQFDMYNLLNVGPTANLNNRYGAAWLQPTAVPPGRMMKFGVQLDF